MTKTLQHRQDGTWEDDDQGAPKPATSKRKKTAPLTTVGASPTGKQPVPPTTAAATTPSMPLGANRRESFRKVPTSAYADWNIPGITGITGDAGRPPTQAQRKAGLQKLIATVEERSLALEAQVNASSAEAAADLQADVLADLAAFDGAVQTRLTTLADADAAQQLSSSALLEAAASQRALACEERQAALTSARDTTRGQILARRDSASSAVLANARAAAKASRDQATTEARRLRTDGKAASKRLRDEDARRQEAEAKEAAKAAEQARKQGKPPAPLTAAERQQRAEQEAKAKAKAKAELDARVKSAQADALAEADARLAQAEAQAEEALRAAAAEVERIKAATASAIDALDRSLATAVAQLALDRDALAGHLAQQVAEVRRRAQAELQATTAHVRKIGELGREEANRKYAEGVRTLEADGRHLEKARRRMPELRKALIARLTAGDLNNLKALRDDADATMAQIRQLHGRCLQRYQDLSEGIGTLLALGEQPPGPIVPVMKRVDARLERATAHLTADGAVLEQAGAILLAKTVATMDATQDQQEAAFADAAARHQRVLEHAPSLADQAIEKVGAMFDDVRASFGSFFGGGAKSTTPAPAASGPLAPGPLAPPPTATSQSWLPSWLQRAVADDGADGRILALWAAETQRRATEISDPDDLVDLRMELAGQKAQLSDTQVADIRAQLIGATGKLWNTHGDIFSALATLTPEQRDQIFGDPRGQDVLKELKRKILVNAGPGSSAARHFDQLMAAKSSAEIKAISVHWAGKGGGTNEKTIDAVLDSMVEGQAAQVRAEFARLYGGDETIDEFLKDEYSNRDKSLNAARFEADKAKVAAIKMEMAAKGSGGLFSTSGGTNEEKYLTARQEIHDRYRGPFLSEADAQRAAAQERAELKRIDETLRDRIGMSMAELDEDEFGGKDEGRLRESLAASRDLMIDPAQPGLDPKVAARLATARDRFDANLVLDFVETDEADAGMNQKAFAGKTKAQRDAILAQASLACGEDFLTYAGRKQSSAVERRKLVEYARDGELSDEMALIDAMKGTGTKNEIVHQRIMGKSKEEIAELSERYRQAVVELGLTPDAVRSKIPGGNYTQYSYLAGAGGLGAGVDGYVYFQSLSGNLFDDIDSEMGGIKWKEIKYTLEHGTPRTPEEKLAYQQYLHDYVRHSGIMPQGFRDWSQGYEGEQSDAELARMTEMVATFKKWGVAGLPMAEIPYVLLRRYQDGDPQFSDPKVVQDAIKELLAVEASTSAWTHGAETRDQATVNMIAQVAGLIVMGLVIVFSGGLAGPALAMVASMAGGLASVGIKLVMLGQKYSREEMMTDIAASLVESLMGSIKLGPLFNKVAAKVVAKSGIKGARAQRLFHNYLTMSLDARQEGAEEFLQALLDSKTWDDAKDIDEVFGRALHNAKLGAASSMTGTLGTNAMLGYKKYRKQAQKLSTGESMLLQTSTDMVAKAWVNDGELTADDAFGSLIQGTRQTLMGKANDKHSANTMRSAGIESRPYDDANYIAYERAKQAGAPKETLLALQQKIQEDVQHRIDHADEVARLYREGQITEEQAAEMMGSPFTIEERVRTMEQNREISPEMAAYILAPGANTKQRFRLYAKVAGQNPIAHEQRVRERLAFAAIAEHDVDLESKGAWPGLDVTWAQVRKELIARIGEPGLINITSVWLCGPTAMGNVFAEGDAHAYALRVIELFFHGTWKGKKVTAEMLSAPKKGGGSVVDWMFLTGFRNTHRNLTGKPFVGESGAHAAQWNLPFEVSGWLSKELDLDQTDSDLVNPEELLGKLDAINEFLPDEPDPSHDGVVIIMIGQSYESPSFDRDGNKRVIEGEQWFDKLQRKASDLIFAKRKMPHHYMRVMSKLVLQDAPEGTPAIKRQVKFKVFEHGRVYEDTMDLGNIYGVVRGRRPQPSLAHLQPSDRDADMYAAPYASTYAAFEHGLIPLAPLFDGTQRSTSDGASSQAEADRVVDAVADIEAKPADDTELDAFEQAALALQAAKEARQAYEESLPEDIGQWTEAQRQEFERLDEAENQARQRYQDAMLDEMGDTPSGDISINDAEALWEEFAETVIYRHGTSTNWFQMISERGLQAGNAPFDANARDWVDYILQRIYDPSARWEDHEYGHSGEVFVTGKQDLAEMYASEAGESVAGVIENVKRIFKLDPESLEARTTPEEREMLRQIAAHFQAIADNHQPLILNIKGSVLANRTDGPAGVEAVREAIRQIQEESGTVTKEAVFRKLAPHEVRLSGVARADIVGLEQLDVTPADLPPLPKIPPKHGSGMLSDSNLSHAHVTLSPADLDQARATYGELIAQLELGDVTAGRGGKSAAMMAAISNVTGRELALLRLKDGRLVWRLGTATSIDLNYGEATIIAHVHPSGDLTFSQADLTELSLRGQHSSVLVGPSGAAVRRQVAQTGGLELGPQLDGDLRDVTPLEVATDLRRWADQLTAQVPQEQKASANKLQQVTKWIGSSVRNLFGKKPGAAPTLTDQLGATPEAVVAQIGDALFEIDRMRALGTIGPVEARRAVAALGRLLFALQRVAPQAVDAHTLDWQQAQMSQLTYELAAPKHQTAVELEVPWGDEHLGAMTTPDGTCGPVLAVGGVVTPELARLAKKLNKPAAQVPWDKLSLDAKHDLLNAQRSGADGFFDDRKLPGMVFRKGVGVDKNGVTFLVPRPEYRGPKEVGDITGIEYHSRRAGYASELTDDAFDLEINTFGGASPSSAHQHIPFWLGNDVLSGNPIARAQLVDYYRRINTLVELYATMYERVAAVQSREGTVTYFDYAQGKDLQTLDAHLRRVSGGGGVKMNVSALKLAMVGARTGDLLDGITNPNAWLDFELRHQGGLQNTDAEFRRAYTDAIQKAALARSYGISDATFIAWYVAQTGTQANVKTDVLISKQHYNRPSVMAEMSLELKNSAEYKAAAPFLVDLGKEDYAQEFKKYPWEDYRARMLVHDWSTDPVFAGQPERIAQVLAAQKAALQMIAEQQPSIRGRETFEYLYQAIRLFVEESGMLAAYSESVGLTDIGLAANAKAKGPQQRTITMLANALTRRGLPPEVVAEFETQAANATTDQELDQLVRSFATRSRTSGALNDVASPQERWPIGTEFDFAARGRWRVIDHTGSVVNLQSIDDPGTSYNIEVSQLEMVAPSATEPAFAPFADLWSPGTQVELGPDDGGWIVTAQSLGSVVIQRDGVSQRVSPYRLFKLNPMALQVMVEGETWQVQSVEPSTHVATIVNGSQTQELHVTALAAIKRSDAPKFDHLPWTGTTLQQAISGHRLERVYQSPYGPIRVSGSVSTDDGTLKVGSLSIQNDLGYVEGGANIGPRLVMRMIQDIQNDGIALGGFHTLEIQGTRITGAKVKNEKSDKKQTIIRDLTGARRPARAGSADSEGPATGGLNDAGRGHAVMPMDAAHIATAFEQYGDLMYQLDQGDVVAGRGGKSAQMMAAVSSATGRELALLRLTDGRMVWRLGTATSVPVGPEVATVIAHVHPSGDLSFSRADIAELQLRDQHSSVLVAPSGEARRLHTPSVRLEGTSGALNDQNGILQQWPIGTLVPFLDGSTWEVTRVMGMSITARKVGETSSESFTTAEFTRRQSFDTFDGALAPLWQPGQEVVGPDGNRWTVTAHALGRVIIQRDGQSMRAQPLELMHHNPGALTVMFDGQPWTVAEVEQASRLAVIEHDGVQHVVSLKDLAAMPGTAPRYDHLPWTGTTLAEAISRGRMERTYQSAYGPIMVSGSVTASNGVVKVSGLAIKNDIGYAEGGANVGPRLIMRMVQDLQADGIALGTFSELQVTGSRITGAKVRNGSSDKNQTIVRDLRRSSPTADPAGTPSDGALNDAGRQHASYRVSAIEAAIAYERHGDLIYRLDQGDVTIGRGGKSARLMAEISNATGRELALLRLTNGRLVFRLGTSSAVPLGDGVETVIAHVHPSGDLSYSPADVRELDLREQRSSVLVAPTGEAQRVDVPRGQRGGSAIAALHDPEASPHAPFASLWAPGTKVSVPDHGDDFEVTGHALGQVIVQRNGNESLRISPYALLEANPERLTITAALAEGEPVATWRVVLPDTSTLEPNVFGAPTVGPASVTLVNGTESRSIDVAELSALATKGRRAPTLANMAWAPAELSSALTRGEFTRVYWSAFGPILCGGDIDFVDGVLRVTNFWIKNDLGYVEGGAPIGPRGIMTMIQDLEQAASATGDVTRLEVTGYRITGAKKANNASDRNQTIVRELRRDQDRTPLHDVSTARIEVSPELIAQAKAQYGELITALELGDVPASRGGKSVAMMAAISNATGRELALLRLRDGQMIWRLGEATTVPLGPEVATVIAHVHPSGVLELSTGDIAELQLRQQKSSVLVSPTGEGKRVAAPTTGPVVRGDDQAHVRAWADRLAAPLQDASSLDTVGDLGAVLGVVEQNLFALERDRALGVASLTNSRRTAAALGRLLFAMERVAPGTVPTGLLDWQEAIAAQLDYEHAAPKHQTAVEFETDLRAAHLEAMTTVDGTCGPVIKVGGRHTDAVRQRATELGVPPSAVPWDSLSGDEKLALLNAQQSGESAFFRSRKLPGLVFRPGYGVDDQGRTFLESKPEYGSPTDVGAISGLEYHTRRPGYASQLADDSFDLEVETFGGEKPSSSHQHIPFWLGSDVMKNNPIARAQLVDYYRRINVLAELWASVYEGYSAHQVSHGMATYFDFASAQSMQTLDKHLRAVTSGSYGKMDQSELKLAMVGARTGDLLDGITNPDAWLDFELRNQGGFENADPEFRRAYTDAIQKAALSRSFGISNTQFMAWFEAMTAGQPMTASVTTTLVARQHYNRPGLLAQVSPELAASDEYLAAEPYLKDLNLNDYAQRNKDYPHEDYRLRMLVHDWSHDPVFASDPEGPARVLEAQKRALAKLAGYKPSTRSTKGAGAGHIQQVVVEFIRESGLIIDFELSVGVDDLGLAAHHDPSPGVTDYRVKQLAALLTRAGLPHDAVFDFRMEAKALTDIEALGALADAYLARHRAGGALHDVVEYQTVATLQPTTKAGTTKLVADIGDLRVNGSHSGPQEVVVEVPPSLQGLRLTNIELVHSQVLSEKSVPWTGTTGSYDTAAPYAFVEVFVEGVGWTNLNQPKKFADGRREADRLHDLPDAGGKILKVRVRNVGIDPLHVHALSLDFLPHKPQQFHEAVFTPGTTFGDAWTGQRANVRRRGEQHVDGTRYPEAIVLNNRRNWAATSAAAQAKAAALGWTITPDSILVPLLVGKTFKLAEVALGDGNPDSKLNPDGEYGESGWSRLSITIERQGQVLVQVTGRENVPPQGVLLGIADHQVKPGDVLRIRISDDTAAVMGVRIGYDDPPGGGGPKVGTTFTKTADMEPGISSFADEHGAAYLGKAAVGHVDHLAAEQAALSIYGLFGVGVAPSALVDVDGTPTLLVQQGAGAPISSTISHDLADGFVIDAWLGNRTLLGNHGSGVMVTGGKARRADASGAFAFAGGGGHDAKVFGAEVGELDAMRHLSTSTGAMAFYGLSDAAVLEQLQAFEHRYSSLQPQIQAVLAGMGLSPAAHADLSAALHARARWMIDVAIPAFQARVGLAEDDAPGHPALGDTEVTNGDTNEPSGLYGGIPTRTAASFGDGIGQISDEQRLAARARHADLLEWLERGHDIVAGTGDVTVTLMQELTIATGREVALLRRIGGERFLRLGDAKSVPIADDERDELLIIAHTHPNGGLLLSETDIAVILDTDYGTSRGSSVVITPTDVARFYIEDEFTRGQEQDGPIDFAGDYSRLDAVQRAVLKQAQEQATLRATTQRAELLQRFVNKGLTEADLELALAYVRDHALLQIQFRPDKLLPDPDPTAPARTIVDSLIETMMYKSVFETQVSSIGDKGTAGSSRDGWEKTIFDGGYHPTWASTYEQRPKYGAINAMGTWNAGVSTSYGNSSIVLKPATKERATVTPFDSAGAKAHHVGTTEQFVHVLMAADDARFDAVVAASKNTTTTGYTSFIEAQVHGPIRMDTDVLYIVASSEYKGTPHEAKLRELCLKAGIGLKWRTGENTDYQDA